MMMKTRLLCSLLLLLAGARITVAQHGAKLDEVIVNDLHVADANALNPCELDLVITAIIRRAGLVAGLENLADCFPHTPWWSPSASRRNVGVNLAGKTWREALDQVTSPTTFRWHEVDGVIVVRPDAAWKDAKNVLSMPAQPFAAKGTLAEGILPRVLATTSPSLFVPYTRVGGFGPSIDRPVRVAFTGGTLLSAVNAAIHAHGSAAWELVHQGPERDALLYVYSLEAPGEIIAPPLAVGRLRRRQ